MEMVAASKMRKAQLVALQSRPYAEKALSILSRIKERQPDIKNLFLDGPIPPESPTYQGGAREGKILAIVVTSDKGLCGGLNGNVLRESTKVFEKYKNEEYNSELALVGIKSKLHFERLGLPIHETFKGAGDYVELDQIKHISKWIQEKYSTGNFNKVVAVYTDFISTFKQEVLSKQILPIASNPSGSNPVGTGSGPGKLEYEFEPSPQAVLKNLIPFLLDIYIYHIILESNASEHSARMVAMRNASENAENILNELTLSYNKARQAAITGEITEITAGVEALQ